MVDVAVIGGGLAGCMAAITLARRGQRVVLLESGEYPRAKVCGELLSPECVSLFADVGFLPHLQALAPTTIHTLRITAPDGSAWRSRFPAPALGISRYALDQALASYAASLGVTVCERTNVSAIKGNLNEGFCLTLRTNGGSSTLRAASVIAAYGKRGNLDRALGRSTNVGGTYIGLKRHFRGAALPQHIDLHVFPGGYCGISQVEAGHTNVCLLVKQSVFQQVVEGDQHDIIDRFIGWMATQNRYLGDWLSDAEPLYPQWLSIGQVRLDSKPPVMDDVLFAGDAVGMIAPLAGDGMAMALHSGSLAAQLLDGFLRRDLDATTLKRRYAHAWRQTFDARLRLGRTLQSLMLHPRLLAAGLHILNRAPTLGEWLVSHTRDVRLMETLS